MSNVTLEELLIYECKVESGEIDPHAPSDYPAWICEDCGSKSKFRASLSTWNAAECGWCKETKLVTEPRDFGYPEFNKGK